MRMEAAGHGPLVHEQERLVNRLRRREAGCVGINPARVKGAFRVNFADHTAGVGKQAMARAVAGKHEPGGPSKHGGKPQFLYGLRRIKVLQQFSRSDPKFVLFKSRQRGEAFRPCQ